MYIYNMAYFIVGYLAIDAYLNTFSLTYLTVINEDT